jgi:hypothetical protein
MPGRRWAARPHSTVTSGPAARQGNSDGIHLLSFFLAPALPSPDRHLIGAYTDPGRAREVLAEVQRLWDRILSAIQVATPDAGLDLMVNRWLLYQVLACRVWGRSALSSEDCSGGRPRPQRQQRRPPSKRPNDPALEVGGALYRMARVDLTLLEGIDESTALVILSEVGPDVSRFPTAKHFTSWLGLCPQHQASAGKMQSRRVRRGAHRAGRALRLAVQGCYHAKHALGAFYRRIQARAGSPRAIVATARKLAERVYRLLKYGEEYVRQDVEAYEAGYQQRVVRGLARRAAELGATGWSPRRRRPPRYRPRTEPKVARPWGRSAGVVVNTELLRQRWQIARRWGGGSCWHRLTQAPERARAHRRVPQIVPWDTTVPIAGAENAGHSDIGREPNGSTGSAVQALGRGHRPGQQRGPRTTATNSLPSLRGMLGAWHLARS